MMCPKRKTDPIYDCPSIDVRAVGERISHLRLEQGLTQEELAEQVGISASYVSHMESGIKQISLHVLVRMAEVLHTSTDVLLTGIQRFHDGIYLADVQNLMMDCSLVEREFLMDTSRAIKKCLRDYAIL